MNSFIIIFYLGFIMLIFLSNMYKILCMAPESFRKLGLLGTSSRSIHDSLQSLEDQGLLNDTFNVETLLQPNKNKETEKAHKVNRNFERLIQLVNILGQVDTFLSERTKSMMRKLALLAEDDDGYYRRRRS